MKAKMVTVITLTVCHYQVTYAVFFFRKQSSQNKTVKPHYSG